MWANISSFPWQISVSQREQLGITHDPPGKYKVGLLRRLLYPVRDFYYALRSHGYGEDTLYSNDGFSEAQLPLLQGAALDELLHGMHGDDDNANGSSGDDRANDPTEARRVAIRKKMYSTPNIAYIRFLAWVMGKVFRSLFRNIYVDEASVVALKRLLREQQRSAAAAGRTSPPVLFLPTHRSHLDYLLLSNVCFGYGFSPTCCALFGNALPLCPSAFVLYSFCLLCFCAVMASPSHTLPRAIT